MNDSAVVDLVQGITFVQFGFELRLGRILTTMTSTYTLQRMNMPCIYPQDPANLSS